MTACIDPPMKHCLSGHPRETEVLFPFRNPGLKVLPQLGATRKSDSDTQFMFKALPVRRLPSGNELEMTSYLQAPLESDHLPHFMRAVTGSFDAEGPVHTWEAAAAR